MTLDDALQQVQDSVAAGRTLRVRGSGSKPALSRDATLELRDISGISEYNPHEYTFTALAGTPLREVEALLQAEGQFLPFEPPFSTAGATLGGTVAAGLSGPGRYRYGGVRDFILGATFINGLGEVVRGGGKVVKNAAGFDFPKLMVGSLGRFGVMVELTFKVFPVPESYATLTLEAADDSAANALMQKLALSSFEPCALEFLPPRHLLVRFGGLAEALAGRLERVQAYLGQEGEVTSGDEEVQLWQDAGAFAWVPEGHALVKIAHSPARVLELNGSFTDVPRRFSVGGNALYLAWPETRPQRELDALLLNKKLPGLALTGSWTDPHLGVQTGGAFLERVARVFDPHGIFSQDVTHAA